MDLEPVIGGVKFRSPMFLGSCDLFTTREGVTSRLSNRIGAVVLKSTTREPCLGYRQPHVANFGRSGLLVASGMANPGITVMRDIVRDLHGIPLIGSVVQPELAREYAEAGALAVELNLSCPHMPGGSVPAHDPSAVSSAVALARSVCDIPIIAKLTGWNCDIRQTARAAENAGADAVTVSNLFPGTGYYTGLVPQNASYRVGDPLLGNVTGGYTSPGFLAGVLHLMALVREACRLPIIATGGCCDSVDALAQSMLAGAVAVETVTPLYKGGDLDAVYDGFLEWRKGLC